jgi:hypothetical protein
MDIYQYIIENYDILHSKNIIELVNNNNEEKKESKYMFSFNKIKNYINKCIDLIKKCI